MLAEQKEILADWFREAAQALIHSRAGELGDATIAVPEVELDRPKQASLGDLACNLALQLARELRMNPRQAAQSIADAVRARDAGARLIDALEIAGPGFINVRLTARARRAVVGAILREGDRFGRNTRGASREAMVEFVSANPTGPLHVGHGRQGALGDAIAALLAANGWRVTREFYYNDAGAQIANLALSVQARARRHRHRATRAFRPTAIAASTSARLPPRTSARETVSAERVDAVTAAGDVDDLDAIRHFAVAWLRHEQDVDLRAFGVRFDNYYLESSLYDDGKVREAVDALVAAGKTFEQRRRALAAHDRLRRRQGPRDAQVRGRLHLLRARTSPIT